MNQLNTHFSLLIARDFCNRHGRHLIGFFKGGGVGGWEEAGMRVYFYLYGGRSLEALTVPVNLTNVNLSLAITGRTPVAGNSHTIGVANTKITQIYIIINIYNTKTQH